jgi:hypothetical protein
MSGNRVEDIITHRCPQGNRMLSLHWPKEDPMTEDMAIWKAALEDICPS